MPKEKRNWAAIGIGIFFVILMVGSVAGILGYFTNADDANSFDFNGHKFTQTDQGFVTKINDQDVAFLFDPRSFAGTAYETDFSDFAQDQKIYVSTPQDTDMKLVIGEVQRLRPLFGWNGVVYVGCPVDSEACKSANMPVRNCADASDTVGVLIFEDGNVSRSTFENHCLTVQGSLTDAARYVNYAAMKRAGVL